MGVSGLVLVSSLLAISPNDFFNLFETHEYSFQQERIQYRLFVPRKPAPGETYPVLVWLHSGVDHGADNQRNIKWLDYVLNNPDHIERFRFFILAVQCPADHPSWPDFMLAATEEILQETMQKQPIDRSRVYATGISAGGSACWRIIARNPDLFAAVVPLASGGNVSTAARLANTSIWAFHSRDDGKPPLEMVEAVKHAGGNIHLTLLPSPDHNCWTKAFQEYGIMEWMLQQRRGAAICWTPPGCPAWRWWHILSVPCAFLVVTWLGWRSEQRRRRRNKEAIIQQSGESNHGQPCGG